MELLTAKLLYRLKYYYNLLQIIMKMNFSEFLRQLQSTDMPTQTNPSFMALWHLYRRDLDEAHELIQHLDQALPCLIHGFIHKTEGDHGNASYWYRRGGLSKNNMEYDEEWLTLAERLYNNLR